MEFLVAVMVYLGIISPDATVTMTQAEMDYLIQSNQQSIQCVLADPQQTQIVAGFEIDRRED